MTTFVVVCEKCLQNSCKYERYFEFVTQGIEFKKNNNYYEKAPYHYKFGVYVCMRVWYYFVYFEFVFKIKRKAMVLLKTY